MACKILKVLRSGYYNYLSHKLSAKDIKNRLISEEIQKIFDEHKGCYGFIRIAKALETQGLKVNRKQVSRLIQLVGLCPKGTNYKYKRYYQQNKHEEYPNLLNRIFKAESKNKIWVGDITYKPTKKRNLYLAVFLDVYLRRVVGWSMDTKMRDKLVIAAFNQAYGKEYQEAVLIVYADQGSQFTSGSFQMLLKYKKTIHRESRKGNPSDNALMKSFYRTIKKSLFAMSFINTGRSSKRNL